ncbi:hypothetical protein BDR07DRAFT_415755 [Suillus spraguei]|nr:hypothetical protein BDR07DRAFT_415755 [Suillus spraguei]
MTIVSNDPTWWPVINANILYSYLTVASSIIVMYDWVLTFGQEVELVWRQRCSLMTVMYLGVRYFGILHTVLFLPGNITTIRLTDTVSYIFYYALPNWTCVVVFAMLWVIVITRLHAMYQGSRKVLIFLVVTFLVFNIFDGVANIILTVYNSGEELILSVVTVWEVLTLCLAVWIAVKHYRELRQYSTGGIIGDCFTVMMKTHVLYFASFVAVACLHLITIFSPTLSSDPYSLDAQIYNGLVAILEVVQMFVLGPRLILSVREYHAKLVVDSDAATGMTSIAFQERVHISTGSSV